MRLVFLICIAAGALYVAWSGLALPPVVASHFGVGGAANGFMPRNAYLAVMIGVVVIAPTLLALTARGLRKRSADGFNLPNRDYWLAPERHDATLRTIIGRMQGFACLLVGLLCFVHHEVVVANGRSPPALDGTFFVGIVAFLAITVAWVVALYLRFSRVP